MYARLLDLIRSLFTMNQLLRYVREEPLGIPDQPRDVATRPAGSASRLRQRFQGQAEVIRSDNEDEEQELPAEIRSILDAPLPAFDRFIEVVTHVRQKHHRTYLVEMLDKLFQKNGPYGALVQGKSASNPRRWQLGGRLLEVFVQLAVLRWQDTGNRKLFYSQPVLVDDFLRWVEAGTALSCRRRLPCQVRNFRSRTIALIETTSALSGFD